MFVSYVLRTVHAKYFGTRDAWAPITTRRIAVRFFYTVYFWLDYKKKHLLGFMGAGRGVQGRCTCTPLEFENDDVICCLQVKCTQNVARASGARTDWPKTRYKNSKSLQKWLILLLTHKSSMICVSTNTHTA